MIAREEPVHRVGEQEREKERILGESGVELSIVYLLGKAVNQLVFWEEMMM